MIQEKIIKDFSTLANEQENILAAVLYGSFARKDANVNSDIDIAIGVNESFNITCFQNSLQNHFGKFDLWEVFYVKLRKKIVLYFKDNPKLEIVILDDIKELKRNYLGSLIPKSLINDTIVKDKTGELYKIISEWYIEPVPSNKDIIDGLITNFMYEFESCSTMHRRSDGYRFYYFYNIAFHVAVQLKYISENKFDFYFLPRKTTVTIITEKEEQQKFYDTSGTTDLRDANTKKRSLLDLFYSALEKMNHERLNASRTFLEKIYNRDFIWNFRDIGKFNPKIKKGLIYRTSALTAYQDEEFLMEFLNNKNIKTIIDLRAFNEIEKRPYRNDFIAGFDYHITPFDPWDQPQWFKETENYGTNTEIAYRFFVKACKPQIKEVFETILSTKNAIVIHCLAGKDRTGFIVMLINMLINTPYEIMLNDYLASELDAEENKFRIYYENILNEGGITSYLMSCGLNENNLVRIKNKLTNE